MTDEIKYDDFFFRGKKYSLQQERLICVTPFSNICEYYFYLKVPMVFVKLSIKHAQGHLEILDRDYKIHAQSRSSYFVDFNTCPYLSLCAINSVSHKLFECSSKVVSKEDILTICEKHLNKYWTRVKGEEKFNLFFKTSYEKIYEYSDTATDVEIARGNK